MPSEAATASRRLTVVVPVYNGAKSLPELVDRLNVMLPRVAEEHEVVLVNDGSADESWTVIAELVEQHDHVRAFDMMRNYGQHNALLCGIRAARFETIVTMDDDLQHPPEEIPKLLAELDRGFDVVYGAPENRAHGVARTLASSITKLVLQRAMGAECARRVSAFRALRTKVRRAFDEYRSPLLSLDVLLTWGTQRFSVVTVRHEPRELGVSNYTFGKLLGHALNMMTGFSTLPLQLASWVGFGFTLFGAAVLAYVIGRYLLQGAAVPGFAFLASIISIFSGAQLFALGIIGEYLARMFGRMMERPTYVIRDRLSGDPTPP